jgi:hypothetical protein
MSTPPKPPLDPIVEAQIERSVSRYAALVPPEMLATMRKILEDALTTHPVAVKLVDNLRERAVPDMSGTVVKDGAAPISEEKTGGDKGAS